MFSKTLLAALVATLSLTFVGVAHAQHAFSRTVTVDQSGNADETSIQDAIDNIGSVSERFTVLIYSGTYDENVTLGDEDENIDLVGIDPDGVIIAPSSGVGIEITSGAETSRNNAIRNLTINTTTGHGIKIVHDRTPVPKDIIIEGVTINADGTGAAGIHMEDAENVLISGCTIDSDNADGITLFRRDATEGSRGNSDESHIKTRTVKSVAMGRVSIKDSRIIAAKGRALHYAKTHTIADAISTQHSTPQSWTKPTDNNGVWIPFCLIGPR